MVKFVSALASDVAANVAGASGSSVDDVHVQCSLEALADVPCKAAADRNSSPAGPLEAEPRFNFWTFLAFAGPGIIMSTAFFDPGDLEAGIQAGGQYQFQLLWIYLWCTVLGWIMQMLAAKLGVATGRDLSTMCREETPYAMNILLWLILEASLVAVEIQYIIGAAVGLSLLVGGGLPLWGSVLICSALAYGTLMLDVFNYRFVEYAFFGMIGVMVVCLAIFAGISKADGTEVLRGLAEPQLPAGVDNALVAGGILGGCISPYNIFFFSTLVISRKNLPMATRGEKRMAMKYYKLEACIALFLALFMNVCTVCTMASAFYNTDEPDASLTNVGDILGDIYGRAFTYIWALGLFATGLSSSTGSVYAGQSIMGGFINIRLPIFWRAFITRTIALIPALVVAAVWKKDDDSLDQLNLWLNLLQTLALPFALLPLVHFTCSRRLMGGFWINRLWHAVLVMAIAVFSIFVACYCTYYSTPLPDGSGPLGGTYFGFALYIAAILYFLVAPDRVDYAGRWLWRQTQIMLGANPAPLPPFGSLALGSGPCVEQDNAAGIKGVEGSGISETASDVGSDEKAAAVHVAAAAASNSVPSDCSACGNGSRGGRLWLLLSQVLPRA